MGKPVFCECGAVLVEEATDSGVKLLGGEDAIVFRRRTDYVVCQECYAVYPAADILQPAPEEELAVEKFERMLEEGGSADPPAAPAP